MILTDLTPEELLHRLTEAGHPSYRAGQLLRWIYGKGILDPGQMTNVPDSIRQWIGGPKQIIPLTEDARQKSGDGTVKFGFRLQDGQLIESVSIPMETGRPTFCISSQVGCAMGCRFCATAGLGFTRNLSAGEIVSQVLLLKQHAGLKEKQACNIVFMGMGEPLMNVDNVLKAIDILTHPDAGCISPNRITLSTCGVISGLKRLAQRKQLPLIALSLNAADQETRESIMPITRTNPLTEVLSCLRKLPLPKRERITMEYVLIDGVNDRPEDARNLVKLLNGLRYKVNLIPFNPFPGSRFRAPRMERVEAFEQELIKRHVTALIRKSKGQDIQGACGQLAASDGCPHNEKGAAE